jgi:4-hydroxythreonine-4-phosphate dehydrogenase
MTAPWRVLERPRTLAHVPPGCLPVLVPPGLPGGLASLPWGVVDAAAARRGAPASTPRCAGCGRRAAIVTAPIHKEALAAAGVPSPAHRDAAGAGGPGARAAGAHDAGQRRAARGAGDHPRLALRRPSTPSPSTPCCRRCASPTPRRRPGARRGPRIAVAGLNPHAGEGGLFGDEEIRIIAPAVRGRAAEGIDAHGPFPPDTVFMRAATPPGHPGEFDLVVAMTHDHGLIPVKYLGVEQGVNVTLGLPFVRTSPDHGTAFDIAGRGKADPSSLVAALQMARRLVAARAPLCSSRRRAPARLVPTAPSAASCRRARAVARSSSVAFSKALSGPSRTAHQHAVRQRDGLRWWRARG